MNLFYGTIIIIHLKQKVSEPERDVTQLLCNSQKGVLKNK